MAQSRVVGAILAGGEGRRMGTDKALVTLGEHPFVWWVGRALLRAADQVIIAGRTEPIEGYEAVPDPEPGRRGPLAGIVGALQLTDVEAVLAVAVDAPFVSSATLGDLARRGSPDQPCVPVADGVPQVTCAFYPKSFLPAAHDELLSGGSIRSALATAGYDAWTDWSDDGRSWWSVDTPDDLAEGLRRFGYPPM